MTKVNSTAAKLAYKKFQEAIENYYAFSDGTLTLPKRHRTYMIQKHIYRYFLHQTCKIAGIKQQWCADYCNVSRGGTFVMSSLLVYDMVKVCKDKEFIRHFTNMTHLWWETITCIEGLDTVKFSRYINLF